mmetsp:Transcript_26663/g.26905  ORF Transcript_26663/g.26905 Transcript_26663/m.26905 type:complete len:306 (+) Transcript_26663:106-1023(+)
MSPYAYDNASGIYTHNGKIFKQIWQNIPQLKPFYMEFENTYEIYNVQTWMIDNPFFPIMTVCFYLCFCYFGSRVMKSYKPLDLKYPLAIWNFILASFSAWGTFRTMPHLIFNIFHNSFESTVCEDPVSEWGIGATGFAVQMFILSKFPELIDTVFIVLKKKPLIFLHWYHHVTVLLYCWNAYVTEAGIGLYFVVMNYTVHSVMYFYYFLQSIKVVPKWFPSWIITILQISQMFIGMYVVGAAIYFYNYGGNEYPIHTCSNKMSNMIAGAVMYMSYATLFLMFAVERFVYGPKVNIKARLSTKKFE